MNANLLAKYLYKAGDTVKQGRAGSARHPNSTHTHMYDSVRATQFTTELFILNPQEPEMQEPLQFKLLEARISAAKEAVSRATVEI